MNNKEKKRKVIELFVTTEMSQKDISKEVGVSEKTTAVWLKTLKPNLETSRETITILQKRLLEMAKDPKATAYSMKMMSSIITETIQNQFKN